MLFCKCALAMALATLWFVAPVHAQEDPPDQPQSWQQPAGERVAAPSAAEGNPPPVSKPIDEKAADKQLRPAEPPSPGAPIVPPFSEPESPVLEWDPHWAQAGGWNYAFIGINGAVAGATAILRPSGNHNILNPILFDKGSRNALRLPTQQERYIARDASDVFLSLETTWPVFVDSLIVAYGTRRSPHVAYETAMIDLEAITLTLAVQQLTANLVSRPRPYLHNCGGVLPAGDNDCVRNTRYRSFFSGHASMAFTGASLICAHRARLEFFGPTADVATCVTAYVVAAATATLRVASDMHYASDVISGAIVGTAIGLGIPALHYRKRDRDDVEVSFFPVAAGMGVTVRY
jgi:membrane-associated phospholipid phosphatase